MTALHIKAMTPDDYDEVLELWTDLKGIGLNDSDTFEDISLFLMRNPGLSAVAISDGKFVGAVLCGHDGQRGYLHHLAVSPTARRKGIASALLNFCFEGLAQHHVPKCNIFVYNGNREGLAFWQHNGWRPRDDLSILQRYVHANA